MPLPWLIGAAVVGIGAAIAAAVSDDDKPSGNSSSSSDDAEQRRRREAAEQERKGREREQKVAAAHAQFKQRGEDHGASLRDALDGLANVIGDDFTAKLEPKGLAIEQEIDGNTLFFASELRDAFPGSHDDTEAIVDNLRFYTTVYHRAFQLTPAQELSESILEAKEMTSQLEDLDRTRKHLLGLKQQLAMMA